MKKINFTQPSNKVTPERLDVVLRIYGIQLSPEILGVVIDLVELLEHKGGNATISDVIEIKHNRKNNGNKI